MTNLGEWIEVNGHPDYEVSSFGEVRKKGSDRFLPKRSDRKGYLKVYVDGEYRLVHRLVAESFFLRKEDAEKYSLVVVHADGDKHNNHVSNLEWRSREYVREHAIKMKRLRYSTRTDVVFCKDCCMRNQCDFGRGKGSYFFCADGKMIENL